MAPGVLKTFKKEFKQALYNLLEFELHVQSTNDYDKSQVTTGGISLSEIDPATMETTSKGLFLAGEILDVDGKCGGFNLGFAFIFALSIKLLY